jgi:hypothetical protein
VSPQRGFAADQRRAFRLLAAAPNGATEAIMLAHGFTVETLGRWCWTGTRRRRRGSCMPVGGRFTVTWLTITEIGRQVLTG